MGAAEPISVTMPDGGTQTFPSLSQACAHFRVPLKRAHERLKYFGWTPEEALEIVPHQERIRPITVTMSDGTPRLFDSLRQASSVLGVPYLIAYKRLDRKWTPEQAFRIEPPPKRESPAAKQVVVTVNGVTLYWPSLDQAAKANGLTGSAVKDRLRRGWTLPQALGLEDSGRPPHKIAITVTDSGVTRTFESITEAAKAYQLSVDLVNSRLHTLKWTVEEALGIVTRPGYDKHCDGFSLIKTKVQQHGIPLSSASRWLKKGTPEQAFGLAPKPKRKSSRGNPLDFTHDGHEYHYASMKASADAHGVSESNLQRRLKEGWSIQEALELVERPGAEQKKPVRIRLDGKMVTYASRGAAARSHGLSVQTLLGRLRSGWTVRRALLTPPGKQGRRRKQK